MKDHVQRGEPTSVTAAAERPSGDGVLIGSLFAVAAEDASRGIPPGRVKLPDAAI